MVGAIPGNVHTIICLMVYLSHMFHQYPITIPRKMMRRDSRNVSAHNHHTLDFPITSMSLLILPSHDQSNYYNSLFNCMWCWYTAMMHSVGIVHMDCVHRVDIVQCSSGQWPVLWLINYKLYVRKLIARTISMTSSIYGSTRHRSTRDICQHSTHVNTGYASSWEICQHET